MAATLSPGNHGTQELGNVGKHENAVQHSEMIMNYVRIYYIYATYENTLEEYFRILNNLCAIKFA